MTTVRLYVRLTTTTHWLNNVLNPVEYCSIPGWAFETSGSHLLAVTPSFARDGLIHPRNAQWETYKQTWRAYPLHLYHSPEENCESNHGLIICSSRIKIDSSLPFHHEKNILSSLSATKRRKPTRITAHSGKSLDIKLHNDINFFYRKWKEIVIFKE